MQGLTSDYDEKIKNRLNDFSKLLESLNEIENKKKSLWLEIYENAICDRQLAFSNYANIVSICNKDDAKSSSEFAIHAKSISTFISNMSKANDQLLRLNDLISKELDKLTQTNDDIDIYAEISKKCN